MPAASQRITAAGTVLMEPGGRVLFVQRSKIGDHPGEWALPGGKVEEGETAEEAAAREAEEEVGLKPAPLRFLARSISQDSVDFSTFGARVSEAFCPKLNAEHDYYRWAFATDPPIPLHPGLKSVLQRIAKDGHMLLATGGSIELKGSKRLGGQDARPLAFDEASVRSIAKDGHLHISTAHISKAAVNPYRGAEIPGWKELGLDVNKVYNLLRDPEEMERAAPSFNNLPVLDRHVPVTADAHPNDLVIGATGSHSEFDDGYLNNNLVFWTRKAIDDIEQERKKEISAAYRYRADMTPGKFEGVSYDGVMRDICGNHVALVENGRAGNDVVVGDSMENLMKKKSTALGRKALFLAGGVATALLPVLAQDAKIDISPLFEGVTAKNFKAKRDGIVAGLKKLTAGHLAQDADLEGVCALLDKLDGVSVADATDTVTEGSAALPINLKKDTSQDEGEDPLSELDEASPGLLAQVADLLRAAGVDEAIIAKVEELDDVAGDEDTEEEKKKKDDEAKVAKDRKPPAMDQKTVTAAIEAAVKSNTDTLRAEAKALRTAEADVEPYVGKLAPSLAMDSAEMIYRHTLKAINVDASKVSAEGLRPLLLAIPKPGRKAPVIALDAKPGKGNSFEDRYPRAQNIRTG